MGLRPLLLFLFLIPTSDPVVTAIVSEARSNSRVMEYLERLPAPRLTSSTRLTEACEWAKSEFEKLGLKARLEEWGTFPVGFDRGAWSARMVAPQTKELTIGFNAWSAGTNGPVTGPAVLAPTTDDQLLAMKDRLKGAWVISSSRGAEKYRVAYDEAGIAGVIRTGAGELIHTGGNPRIEWDKLPTRVTVTLLGSQHKEIVDLLQSGKDVTLTIDVKVEFKQGPIKLYNVIAELAGSEKPDEYVIVGGHIDSWDGAKGITDNGTGVSTTLEAARLLTKAGAKPKRTIRFMLWSGEEQGLLGSRAYIKAHPEENAKISAVLVHDGGTNYASGINATDAMIPLLEKVLDPLVKLDPSMRFEVRKVPALPRGIGSDHDSYLAVGVPGFYWLQSGRAKYPFGHHTQNDTLALAIPEYQRHTSIVVAVSALRIADLAEMLPRTNLTSSAPRSRRMLGVQLDDEMIVVEVIESGAADKAGVKTGDKLVKLNETPVADTKDLGRAIQAAPKASKVVVKREGKELEFPVTFPD
jgi:carboxypeptidase Q